MTRARAEAPASKMPSGHVHIASFGDPVLPRDPTEIRVVPPGHFLCSAECQDLAGTTISLKDLSAARNESERARRDQRTRISQLIIRLMTARKD